ncbi:MAG: YbgA family protein, partial [Planctomycetota bacterium JB042]
LAKLDLSGYVLKSKSPSCGMERVKVYDRNGVPGKSDRGRFAAVLMERLSDLPVEEEGRLNDPVLRENFFERVFGRKRISDFFRSRWTVGDLVEFHTREKFTLFAHDPAAYRGLGRVVAEAKGTPRAELEATYRRGHFEAMKRLSTRRKHTDVLQHLAGHLKKVAPDAERNELAREILDYREGLVPRIVPLTILRHLARRYDVTYVLEQHYLSPAPRELMLQNHV